MHAIRAVQVVLLLAMLGACATDPAGRHAPGPQAAGRLWLDAQGQPKGFAQYRRDALAHIARNHVDHADLPLGERERLPERIGPYEWPLAGTSCAPANTHGVLLVHGLTDSPYLMRDLGDVLAGPPLPAGRCFLVRSLLLPGHGTRPGDLLQVRYQDWLDATEWGLRSFAGQAAQVHLVGFSTGGALGLLSAYRQQEEAIVPPLASLVLLAPAIRANDPMARHPWALRALAWTGLLRWVDEHEDRDWAKYESFPLNAGAQIALLGRELDKRMDKAIPVPVFMAVSLNDGTIDTAESIGRFLAGADGRSRLWLVAPGKSGAQADGVDPKMAQRRRDAFDAAVADARRVRVLDAQVPPDVRDIAHTALPVRPDNPHYGRGGDYANCLAYAAAQTEPEAEAKWQACLAGGPQVVYGETPVPDDLPAGVLMRRLTFNPLFAPMVQDMKAFLGNASQGGEQ